MAVENEKPNMRAVLSNGFLRNYFDDVALGIHFGGPMAAFSGFVNDSRTNTIKTRASAFIDDDQPFSHFLPTSLCNFPGSYPMDFPAAPAFTHIFQRRRRRDNKPRRQRTTFTTDQTLKLEIEYNRADYISRPKRLELAEALDLTESQIKIWFQNRRAKDKRIENAHADLHLRNMGFSALQASLSQTAMHSSCGACALSLPFPVPLHPIPWQPAMT